MKIKTEDGKIYEKHNFSEKIIRIFLVPFLDISPKFLIKKLMRKTSYDANEVLNNVGSAKALEVVYTRYNRKLFSRGFGQGIADFFWHHCLSHPKGLRNRLKIVEKELENSILQKVKGGQNNINILTVGAGSARAMTEIVSKIIKLYNCNIKIFSLDKNPEAIELGKKIAKEFGISDNFEWITNKATNIKNLIKEESIDIGEMVGLLDYFSDQKGAEIINQIYKTLKKDGFFITGNIYPSLEKPFLDKTDWPSMYYRKEDRLAKVLEMAGFERENIEIIFEPLKYHIIGIARKLK